MRWTVTRFRADLTGRIFEEHTVAFLEATFGPLTKVLASMQSTPERGATLRAEIADLASQVFFRNGLRQQFLMTRAVKK